MGEIIDIKRKPTTVQVEALRKGAVQRNGIIALGDQNDRTQEGLARRGMGEWRSATDMGERGTHSWFVITQRGRDYLAKGERVAAEAAEERRESAPVVSGNVCAESTESCSGAVEYRRTGTHRRGAYLCVVHGGAQRAAVEAVSAPVAAEERAELPEVPESAAPRSMADAIAFLGSLKVGDRVRVTREGRTADLTVSRGPRRSDGAFGSPESLGVTVSYGVGRYSFEVNAGHLFAQRAGRHTTYGGTRMMRLPAEAPAPKTAADNASEVSARFAARQRGQEGVERDMGSMSEPEHASALSARFAEAQRPGGVGESEVAEDGRAVGFYVTVRHGKQRGFLLGPYATKQDADGNVSRARRHAEEQVNEACFYEYGTARAVAKPGRALPEGKFNDSIGLRAEEEGETVSAEETPVERIKRARTGAGVLGALRAPHTPHGDAGDRVFTIEVTTRVVSGEAESCRFEGEGDPEHECTGDCTSLEGDVRELEAPRTEEVTADGDDLEVFGGDPVAWAVDYIRTKTDAVEPSASPVGDRAREHEWLSGVYVDPYDNSRETHTSVRLTGDWSEEERARVFKGVRGV